METALSTWHDTATRQAILDFVAAVSDPASSSYVPPAERIATFDNDGTLWCEKPGYIQLFFAVERMRQLADADPELLSQPAYKAATEGDLAYFGSLYPGNIPALMALMYDTHAGMSQQEFQRLAAAFLAQGRHPRFGLPYKQCTYQPMRELLRYLQDHDFKVFIATAGGMSFVRTVSEEIYGIPRENVIGSNITFEVGREQTRPILMRKRGLIEPLGDGPGKPVNIELHVGRPPILAGGNADGDMEMLEYAAASGKPYLNLLLHHDDAEREYAYDDGAERVLQLAREQDWTVISMRQDFKTVFGE